MSRTRLTLPMRFRSEQRALATIRDNGLFSIGAQVIATDEPDSPYRVVIFTAKPDAVSRHLIQQVLPGVIWERSEVPT